MNGDFDFTNKVVLVTGSSRGIGAGIITAFGQRGASCVVNYVADPEGRNQADAQRVAAALKQPVVIQCDVGNRDEVSAMMQQIGTTFGGLDILVNNAGILRDRTLRKMSEAEWESVLRVNLNGTFHCIQQAAGILRAGGRIVNIASVSGQLGPFGQANYAASKAGVMALTKVAAHELARQQITVNAIAPGFINTEIHQGMPAQVTKEYLSQIPLGRFGEVEEVVLPVLFLCSAQAHYITGQVMHVNGGFYM
jgi:3-oxoacyl-[acyl-carrier protein] reductase